MKTISVALVDDHRLLRRGLVEVINNFAECQVVLEADNGQELTQRLRPGVLPDVVLLDINMPLMNGYETAAWLRQHYPTVKILALSMYNDEENILKMIRNGARGYVLKDAEISELEEALLTIHQKGFYYSEMVAEVLSNSLSQPEVPGPARVRLSERETEFLTWACTELTYKEIADRMCLSSRTIDGYREALFEKLAVKSRVGLAMYAIRHGLITP